jgi:hypothetical protein
MALPLLTELLYLRLELRTLLRREHVHDLRAQLFARLRVGPLALRARLPELLHDLPDLRFLLIRQIEIAKHAHRAAAMMVALPLPARCGGVRRRLRLLSEAGNGYDDRGYQGNGKKNGTKNRHVLDS